MERGSDLKTYLMSGFSNNKYKSMTLVELYASDTKYYIALERRQLIDNEAISFFHEKGNDIRNAGNIPTDAFRKLKYEQIIDDYLAGKKPVEKSIPNAQLVHELSAGKDEDCKPKSQNIEGAEKKVSALKDKAMDPPDKQEKKQKPKEKSIVEKPLHCVTDGSVLKKTDVKKVTATKTGKSLSFPRYMCPTCNRLYTFLQGYKDLQLFSLGGKKYTNISLEKDNERYIRYLKSPHAATPGTKCYIYGPSKPDVCRVCGSVHISNASIKYLTKKKKKATYSAKFCEDCKTYYVSYNVYMTHLSDWVIINQDEVADISEEIRIKLEEKARKKEEQKALLEEQALKKKMEQIEQEQEAERRRQERLEKEKLEKERLEKERLAREEYERQRQERLHRQNQKKTATSVRDQALDRIHEHDNNIGVKDFVVRRTTFKCRHHDHKLQNIDAVNDIINREGNVKQTTVPAGYCPNCNIFFIMESTYQQLKMRGTPVCRVSDEKAYLSNNSFANGMLLARESILMQYGYTVSQEEGLTSARRRKILAILIDNKILTKSDIISYLDFFINQRKYQYRYEKAIEKWENDREFVSEYKSGSYTQYGVGGIYRKY